LEQARTSKDSTNQKYNPWDSNLPSTTISKKGNFGASLLDKREKVELWASIARVLRHLKKFQTYLVDKKLKSLQDGPSKLTEGSNKFFLHTTLIAPNEQTFLESHMKANLLMISFPSIDNLPVR
jgi:hypothetical protein